MNSIKPKKSVMGPIIAVFVTVLIAAILAGLTFLFTASLSNNIETTTAITAGLNVNESAFINSSGDGLNGLNTLKPRNFVAVVAINGSSGTIIPATNYTLNSTTGILRNSSTSSTVWANVNLTYTWTYIGEANAYQAINATENAGFTVVSYFSLIFLAIIFGAILAVVLRIIVPYINLGQKFGGF